MFIPALGYNRGSGSSSRRRYEEFDKDIPDSIEQLNNMKDFFQAVKDGDLEKTKEYVINKHFNVNCTDENKMTILHHAIINNHYEIFKLLWNMKTNYTKKDKWGLNPIQWAGRTNNVRIVKAIINSCKNNNTPSVLRRVYNSIYYQTTSWEIKRYIETLADYRKPDECVCIIM